MKLFEYEKLKKVNDRLKELEAKKESVQSEVTEILQAIEDTVQAYAMGEVNEEDVQKAELLLKEKTKEIENIDAMIQRVRAVRKTVAIESIPFVKEVRQKKVEAIQSEVDEKVKTALKARELYVRALADVGKSASKIEEIKAEYNAFMREVGEKESSLSLKIPHVYPEVKQIGIYFSEIDEAQALGISKDTQEQAVKYGIIPSWVGNLK